ncbi:unnamed protein product [Closterium sp. Yama58-4]|nr:unnamed protein product [Closterium sp. Yama58-4]
MARRVYGTHSVTVPGWPSAFKVTCCSGKEAVLELLGNPANAKGFVLFPRTETSGAGRVYTTPESAIFWEETQKAAEEQFGPGAVVVPLIISSDATNLSGNERTKVWAVYVSLANIPLRRRWLDCAKILLALLPFPPTRMTPAEKTALFQAAMKVVLADLIVASHTGMAATDPTGVPRFVVPLLFEYVADYPETCKVSCTQQLGSAMPCSLCYVSRAHLGDMGREQAQLRTVEKQEELVADMLQAKSHATLLIPSFLWDFNFSRTIWGNTYFSMLPDILHAIYIGFFVYIEDSLCGTSTPAEIKDERMTALYPEARLVGIGVPCSGKFWLSGANFTASEHGTVMMIAPFVVENQVLPIQARALVGVLEWHESFVRAPYHMDRSLTEFDENTRRMMQAVQAVFPRDAYGWNLLKIHLLTHMPDAVRRAGLPKEYSAAAYENAHIRTCKLPYRASNHRAPEQAILAHNTRVAVLARVESTLPAPRRYRTAMQRAIATGTPQLTRTRRSLTDRPVGDGTADSVFEQGGKSTTDGSSSYWTLRRTSRGLSVEVAVVQRLADRGLHELTGCRILGVTQAMGGLEVVAVERIRRAAHCVPSFVTRGRWYLNRWAFRCHENLT